MDGIVFFATERIEEPPRFDEKYSIYQAFATDPEGRTVEFQTFE
jgi:hypothetical protein